MVNFKSNSLTALVPDWRRHLRAKNLSPSTIRSYLYVAEQFASAADAASASAKAQSNSGGPLKASALPAAIESYLGNVLDRSSASNAAKHYRSLQQFVRWLVDEGELDANPMARIHAPKVPERQVAIFTDAELIRLLSVCKGNAFTQRRSAAILRVLMDTGCRAAEVTGLQLGNVDLDIGAITVLGKGRRVRTVPISAKTAEAISRYLRQRNKHTNAALPDLWLGRKGRLTTSGLGQLLDRLGLRADVAHCHAHRFRHTSAHQWLSAGGGERSLMRIMGWRSPAMLSRYGASAADERAKDEFRRLNLGNRL